MEVESDPPRPRLSDLEIVKNLAFSLLKRSTLNEMLWDLADAIGSMPGFEDSVVYLVQGDQLVQTAAYGLKAEGREVHSPIMIPMGQGIVGTVAATQTAEIITDTREDPRYIRDEFEGLSELTVPVVFQDRVLAVLDTESKTLNAYSADDFEILQTMANIAAPRIASALNEQDLTAARRELANLNEGLEARIDARTRALEQTTSLLRTERDRLTAILHAPEIGLIATDENLKITLASWYATKTLGPKTVPGTALSECLRLSDSESLRESVMTAVESRETRVSTLVADENKTIHIRWTASPVTGPDGDSGFIIVFRNFTRELELERKSTQVQRMQALGSLAAGIAHNFNNYLMAISASLDAAVGATNVNQQCQALETGKASCLEASRLTQELLTYSSGGKPIRKPVLVSELVQSATAVASSGQQLRLEVDVPVGLPHVSADVGQMTQVLSNLLINAAQASPPGSPVSLNASLSNCGEFITFRVADSGSGISPDVLPRLFDPYFTTKTDGTGLGLSTSYFIVQEHGGRIEAQNRVEGGAEFSFTVPTTRQLADSGSESESIQSSDSLRVLILDDNKLVRCSVSLLLETCGHSSVAVETISQARTAVVDAGDDGFHVAILDLTLDSEDGVEARNQLSGLSPETKFVVSSGYSDAAVMSDISKHGFDGMLPKPYSRDDLVRVLAEACSEP